jgi:hypothetical protein
MSNGCVTRGQPPKGFVKTIMSSPPVVVREDWKSVNRLLAGLHPEADAAGPAMADP